MPVPNFVPGEVLTAAAMDSIGLWRVASGPLSTAGTNFVGCFTSNYTNYRIVVDSPQTSANADIYVQMLSGSTAQSTGGNYTWAMAGLDSTAVNANSAASSQNFAFTGFTSISAANIIIGAFSFDIYGPQLAQRTFMTFTSTAYSGTAWIGRNGMAQHNLTTAYDGIRFLTNSAATMGGNVTIYGYRKP
jgi:hypothetical protein